MTDIVEQLRDYRRNFIFQGGSIYARNLAKEIEDLRQEVAKLLAEKGECLARECGCNRPRS